MSTSMHPAARFIECLTGDPDTPCVFQVLPDHLSSVVEPRTFFGPFANVQPLLEKANKAGAGVFATIHQTRGRRRVAAEVVRARALFVDGDDVPMPSAWALTPTLWHHRSPTRWAAFWVLADDVPLVKVKAAQLALAKVYGGDESVGDLPRVMRLPGFDHCKTPDARACYQLDDADELRVYGWREVLTAHGIDADALAEAEPEVYGDPLEARELPEVERTALLQRLASLPADAGRRHNAMLSWVCDAIAAGMPKEEVSEFAHSYLADAGVDRDLKREVRNALRTATRKASTGLLRISQPGIRPEADFSAVAETTDADPSDAELDEAAAAAQADEVLDWMQECTRHPKTGFIDSTESNASRFFCHHDTLAGLVRWCLFSEQMQVTRNPPWARTHSSEGALKWNNSDDLGAAVWFQRNAENKAWELSKVAAAAQHAAARNAVHPVRNYLRSLTWDGTPRLDLALTTYWGVEDTPLHRAWSAKVFIGACRRVERPGCKLDTMLILEGPQGCGKSRSLAALVPDSDWFGDPEIDVSNKDAAGLIRGKWIVEMGEMHALKRAEATQLKAFLTRQKDRQREAYARHVTEISRQCIFIGTTNEQEYLRDQTGGRRFWPVAVGEINIPAIAQDRDQLWAEAYARMKAGESHWLDGTLEAEAAAVQATRRASDPWAAAIAEYLGSEGDFGADVLKGKTLTVHEVAEHALGLRAASLSGIEQQRIAGLLREAGLVKTRKRVGGMQVTVWEFPGD